MTEVVKVLEWFFT